MSNYLASRTFYCVSVVNPEFTHEGCPGHAWGAAQCDDLFASVDVPEVDEDVLGPCGCYDYHMSDCSTRTGSHDYWSEAESAYYDNDY